MPRVPEPWPRQRSLTRDGTTYGLVGTIQGLKGEDRFVDAALRELGAPGVVAIGVGTEDVANLVRMGDQGPDGVQAFLAQDLDSGSYEEAILPQLSRFGDITMPPDDLLRAESVARGAGVPLEPLDLDDEAYADLYVAHVSGWQMIRGQAKQKRLVASGADTARSPEELMLLWDATFRSIKGYDRIEADREAHMARRLLEVGQDHDRVLAVMPYARLQGVADRLQETD